MVEFYTRFIKDLSKERQVAIMELYGGIKVKLTPLQIILRSSTDEQLEGMNLAANLDIKLEILKEFSFRNFKDYVALSDGEILQKCLSESQLVRSLALRVSSFRELV